MTRDVEAAVEAMREAEGAITSAVQVLTRAGLGGDQLVGIVAGQVAAAVAAATDEGIGDTAMARRVAAEVATGLCLRLGAVS